MTLHTTHLQRFHYAYARLFLFR